tara:strand:- start:1107 stop:1679 length:573 start_codon:yes stop_codon:yes gene_type:complete
MEKSETIKDLASALAKFQGALALANKNSKGVFNNKYADLAEIWDTIREPLAQNNLSVTQPVYNSNDSVGVATVLMHSSGQYLMERFGSVPLKKGPQEIGSLISYYRRYGLAAMLGVAQQDDDATSAERGHKKSKAPTVEYSPKALKEEILSLLESLNRSDLDEAVNNSVNEANGDTKKLVKIKNRLTKLR